MAERHEHDELETLRARAKFWQTRATENLEIADRWRGRAARQSDRIRDLKRQLAQALDTRA